MTLATPAPMTMSDQLPRAIEVPPRAAPETLSTREWLVTNGLGGYASGTVGGIPTRRYHGILIAALPNPAGRVMMLNYLGEQIRFADQVRVDLGWAEPSFAAGASLPLTGFRLELGLPVWTFASARITIERRLVIAYRYNTVIVMYRLIAGEPVRLELRPALHVRGHDEPLSRALPDAYELRALGARIEVSTPEPYPGLRFHIEAPRTSFVIEPQRTLYHAYTIEEARGYAARGQLYSPGRFRTHLTAAGVAFVASTESWETIMTLSANDVFVAETQRRHRLIASAVPRARQGAAAELVLAADQFIFRPVGRRADHVHARASGDETCSVIAGYHWFTDWGRDTMISLEGLTLVTGRIAEAGSILRTFAHHVRDGLVPNMFPEGESQGLYHTADATLWFFHAIDRYLRASNDETTLVQLLPVLRMIIDRHLAGTLFGIGVDPADGLLRQGAPGYQLTWMDARCGDWVVTPRRGKAVEINALWYNALCLMASWLERAGDATTAARLAAHAELAKASFARRFWNPATGHLFDVVDGEHGDDPACRPNQIFALSLPNPILDQARWAAVLQAVEQQLVTPYGLRSLAPIDPAFKPTYDGDLRNRDAAYHQGTVWSWLVGAYIDARLRVRPDDIAGARACLEPLIGHLGEACIGSISEIFDAIAPFTARGCIAQAWGVAELLRALVITGN
jgi:predicted glycogen debranching enzyme